MVLLTEHTGVDKTPDDSEKLHNESHYAVEESRGMGNGKSSCPNAISAEVLKGLAGETGRRTPDDG